MIFVVLIWFIVEIQRIKVNISALNMKVFPVVGKSQVVLVVTQLFFCEVDLKVVNLVLLNFNQVLELLAWIKDTLIASDSLDVLNFLIVDKLDFFQIWRVIIDFLLQQIVITLQIVRKFPFEDLFFSLWGLFLYKH